jgi:hypothetical protein
LSAAQTLGDNQRFIHGGHVRRRQGPDLDGKQIFFSEGTWAASQ